MILPMDHSRRRTIQSLTGLAGCIEQSSRDGTGGTGLDELPTAGRGDGSFGTNDVVGVVEAA